MSELIEKMKEKFKEDHSSSLGIRHHNDDGGPLIPSTISKNGPKTKTIILKASIVEISH